jgi:hypothetical protein
MHNINKKYYLEINAINTHETFTDKHNTCGYMCTFLVHVPLSFGKFTVKEQPPQTKQRASTLPQKFSCTPEAVIWSTGGHIR